MASATPAISDPGGREAWPARRVEPDQRRAALSVLLTGSATGGDVAVDQFLRFARDQKLDLTELWAVAHGERLLASALIVPSPGRSAMVFNSPVAGREDVAIHAQLVGTACHAQDPQKLRLIQSLLDPHQSLERRALERAGFDALAVLIYMQRGTDVGRKATPPDLGVPGIEALHWSEANRKAFEVAITASYEQTLDCPRLLGVRPIPDVVAGHRATGVFDPKLWFAFYHGQEPVGVMLLAEIPQRQALELVYLGVSAAWRGRGLSRQMLQLGLEQAARRGIESMVLAVDELNTPALALYRALSFRPTARKTAMILTFP